MMKYKNLGGNSAVKSFEMGDDWIEVTFNDGATYRYSHVSAGAENVRELKRCATRGEGLNSYINSHVRKKYVR